MAEEIKFNGLTLVELKSMFERLRGDEPTAAGAVVELIEGYKLAILERDICLARMELLRKAASGI